MAGTIEIPMREIEFKPGAQLFLGKQSILMRVLEVNREEGTALLIADSPVCSRAYHERYEAVTWETCSLRAWLNGKYYETTFTEGEKAAIVECTLKNPDNPEYHTPGGKDTTDKIFLLSIGEAKKYFKDDKDRATGTWWWLRSPGRNSEDAAIVYIYGGILNFGINVNGRGGVRPAFQIDLTSEIFRSFIVSESSESIRIRNPQMQISEGKVICAPADLEKAEIPEGVTSIGEEAFHGCSSLTSVTIPESVTSIGEGTFRGCSRLSAVNVSNKLSPSVLIDACLFGAFDDPGMSELISQVKKWDKNQREMFYKEYFCSDTRAAMLLAEKRKELDKYAALRGMDADELRDKYLSDLGLDMQGRKNYDLGNMTVTVRMNPDFTFTAELPDGKTSKSLPKKGADPALYDAANKDFAQIKKDVKKIWKNRADLLLGDFISGKERSSATWKKAYGGNPILHRMACLLVWEQGGKTFLRTDDGLVTADGSAYNLTDEPIKVAHPMEMDAEKVTAWQKAFTSRGVKQPFAQIWERAYTQEEIAEDRYAGCPILFFQLQGAEKHGFNQDLKIPGCEVQATWSSEEAANGNKVSYCDIRSFRIKKYSRAVNHALAYLDRVTIEGRIKKDDADVMKSVEGCNVAQVTETIRIAQEAQAVNVLALLLEYKNAHFADFDPMEEFTLEW